MFSLFKRQKRPLETRQSETCPENGAYSVDDSPEFIENCKQEKIGREIALLNSQMKEFSRLHTKFMAVLDDAIKSFPGDKSLQEKRNGYQENYAILAVNSVGGFLFNTGKYEHKHIYTVAIRLNEQYEEKNLIVSLNESEKKLMSIFLSIESKTGINFVIEKLDEIFGNNFKSDRGFKENLERFIKMSQENKAEIRKFTLSFGGKSRRMRRVMRKTRKTRKTHKVRKTKSNKN